MGVKEQSLGQPYRMKGVAYKGCLMHLSKEQAFSLTRVSLCLSTRKIGKGGLYSSFLKATNCVVDPNYNILLLIRNLLLIRLLNLLGQDKYVQFVVMRLVIFVDHQSSMLNLGWKYSLSNLGWQDKFLQKQTNTCDTM